jgi:hypothetical protein
MEVRKKRMTKRLLKLRIMQTNPKSTLLIWIESAMHPTSSTTPKIN